MKKKRFFYAVVSFMRMDKKDTKVMYPITCAMDGEENEESMKFFPVLQCIKNTKELCKGTCNPQTVMVENLFEISESDYEGIREENKLEEIPETTFINGNKEVKP